eukprot:4892934-Pleurochrysis_carterae.AAC.3
MLKLALPIELAMSMGLAVVRPAADGAGLGDVPEVAGYSADWTGHGDATAGAGDGNIWAAGCDVVAGGCVVSDGIGNA